MQKVKWVEQNGAKATPDERPTVFTEDEVNGCFSSGAVKLPAGLEDLRYTILPGHVTARMQVDFDTLTARSSNPLLGLFSGVHQVEVLAHGDASGGVAHSHVDSVVLDGSEIPRFILAMFVQKMLQPKYPQASLDPTFKLPDKVDLVILGKHIVTVTQK